MKEVIVYTSEGCSFCHAAIDFLKEHNIDFTEKNVSTDKDARKELMEMGHMGVPVLIIDGQEQVGFDQAKIENMLGL